MARSTLGDRNIAYGTVRLEGALGFLAYHWLFGVLHELAHLAILLGVGLKLKHVLTRDNAVGALWKRRVQVSASAITRGKACVVRHAGWIASVALAIAMEHQQHSACVRAAAWLTAVEALATDLLRLGHDHTLRRTVRFACGNFGLLLLDLANKQLVPEVLKRMVEITMARGAQCGGVVSYVPVSSSSKGEEDDQRVGVRSRVVNGKRTDLSELLLAKFRRDHAFRPAPNSPYFVQGHTRFATSSKVTFNGTHPHQWNSPRLYALWTGFHNGIYRSSQASVENFVTHNGDLDFVKIHGTWHDVSDVMNWLERVFDVPMPSSTDSVGFAGMMDLLRTQGLMFQSVRVAYHLGEDEEESGLSKALCRGAASGSLQYDVPPRSSMEEIAGVLDKAFMEFVTTHEEMSQNGKVIVNTRSGRDLWKISQSEMSGTLKKVNVQSKRGYRQSLVTHMAEALRQSCVSKGKDEVFESCGSVPIEDEETDIKKTRLYFFVREVVYAFFEYDLFTALRMFMKNARGSFGVCVSSSVDANRQVALASRGQTISIAFYPRLGMVLWGSELAATKAALGLGDEPIVPISSDRHPSEAWGNLIARRLDLDDTGGEVCLLDFSADANRLPSVSRINHALKVHTPLEGVRMLLQEEELLKFGALSKRMLPLEDNPLITPLPIASQMDRRDLVAKDIRDLPYVLKTIRSDFEDSSSLNSMSMWTLRKALTTRIIGKSSVSSDDDRADVFRARNTVDVIITGCEVSLWLAEQFQSDLSYVYPQLSIRSISANKLLGMLGQSIPTLGLGSTCPQEATWNIADAVVLIVTHSGSTFPSLAVAKLMPNYTKHVFAITSDWDTEVGRQLRSKNCGEDWQDIEFASRIFTSHAGLRFAEPCSLTVAAIHQVLTEILLNLMYFTRPPNDEDGELASLGTNQAHKLGQELRTVLGASHSARDISNLYASNKANIVAISQITGSGDGGNNVVEKTLRGKGAAWAKHVLESPKSWLICAAYIIITVTWGKPLVTGVLANVPQVFEPGSQHGGAVYRVSLFVDAIIYLFCAQWSVLLLRVFEGRPLLHRLAGGRSVVIGDIPWVAQSVEAYLSKLFAVAYSAASIHVYSGNPWDHLVHRHTHRVVRGVLLAVGRPDGRIAAHSNAEASACLSLSQASSIQSLGGTCESLTVGHNRFQLPLSAHAVALPDRRTVGGPLYLCEKALEQDVRVKRVQEARSAARSSSSKKNSMKKATTQQASSEIDMVKETSRSPASLVGFFSGLKGKKFEAITDIHAYAMKMREDMKSFSGLTSRHLASGILALVEGETIVQWSDLDVERCSMVLQETRFDSMQRCVSFFVMFHEMAKCVADFWRNISLGLLGYSIHRTHSIMRVATTACPVSGMEVRERQKFLAFSRQWNMVTHRIRNAIVQYKVIKRAKSYASLGTRTPDGSVHGEDDARRKSLSRSSTGSLPPVEGTGARRNSNPSVSFVAPAAERDTSLSSNEEPGEP